MYGQATGRYARAKTTPPATRVDQRAPAPTARTEKQDPDHRESQQQDQGDPEVHDRYHLAPQEEEGPGKVAAAPPLEEASPHQERQRHRERQLHVREVVVPGSDGREREGNAADPSRRGAPRQPTRGVVSGPTGQCLEQHDGHVVSEDRIPADRVDRGEGGDGGDEHRLRVRQREAVRIEDVRAEERARRLEGPSGHPAELPHEVVDIEPLAEMRARVRHERPGVRDDQEHEDAVDRGLTAGTVRLALFPEDHGTTFDAGVRHRRSLVRGPGGRLADASCGAVTHEDCRPGAGRPQGHRRPSERTSRVATRLTRRREGAVVRWRLASDGRQPSTFAAPGRSREGPPEPRRHR